MSEICEIVEFLQEIKDEAGVPKNVKLKINEVIESLKGNEDVSLKKNKALDILDEIANDTNLQPFSRTLVWNVVSLLETI